MIDSTEDGNAFAYLHGVGTAILGLETALEGKIAGEALAIRLTPEQAYGQRNEALVQVVPLERCDTDTGVEVGMQFEVGTDVGGRAW